MIKGVYVPTLLTILGVILYLRTGWVVGNVGLLGAWMIIVIAFSITTSTALSMSSIISNIRIGPGGPYSIIARSLGMEVGGSIGVPLYFALAFSIALYIFWFREGLRYLFPAIPPVLVDFVTFLVAFSIVFLSTDVAFRVQYIILAIIAASLVSIFAAGLDFAPPLTLTAGPVDGTFWVVFAVFFPAVTGIMAGANMSGELTNPRRSIPLGTLGAIATSLVIYLILAYWFAGNASSSELASNFNFIFEQATVGSVVVAGLLAATFSSALNSFVGASRVLHAMAEHNILPRSAWFSRRSASGIPRNALIFTGIVVAGVLLLRDLNTVAPFITMFFLISYAMINIVILLEQSLGLASFRPLFRIPRIIPLIGTLGCLFVMFIINAVFSLIAVILVAAFYNILLYRHLTSPQPYGDVRSSLFVALAEWAAKKAMSLPISQERAWRPNLLVPVENPAVLYGISEFLRDITFPHGSVSIIGIALDGMSDEQKDGLLLLWEDFQMDAIYAEWTIVNAHTFEDGVIASIQTLKRTLFSPNIVFLQLPPETGKIHDLPFIMQKATENLKGIILYAGHPQAVLGRKRRISLWLTGSCTDWYPGTRLENCDLSILVAYKLLLNWDADLMLLAVVNEKDRIPKVEESISMLIEYARISAKNVRVVLGPFTDFLEDAPRVDINIFSLPPDPDIGMIREIVMKTGSTCIFCRDSTQESALA
ncbi:MAG TPA: amino acid permease [Methanoculleus sp.]|nr:amino acid permease [Methanoculleus sp.]